MKITSSIYDAEDIELRVEGDKTIMYGTVVKFEKLSKPIPQLMGVREKVRKGAFTRTIKNDEIVAVWNHNMDMVLGNTRSGTLRLTESNTGLEFEIDLPDTQVGRDAGISVKRRDVRGVSFWFKNNKDEWDETNKKEVVRTLIDVDLIEISPTPSNIAAYPSSKASMRTIKEDYEERTIEQEAERKAEQEKEEKRQRDINETQLRNQITTLKEKECI